MYYEESLEFYEALLDDVRKLRKEIYERLRELHYQEISIERRKELIAQNQQAEIVLANLKQLGTFKPRNFDVYLSPVEVAIKKYVDENPEPPQDERCSHANGTVLRRRYHANHTLHLVNQCNVCGTIIGNVKQCSEINTDAIPLYDTEVLQSWIKNNSAHRRWRSKLDEIAKAARYAGGDIFPEFDYQEFNRRYAEKYPQPSHSDNCSHNNSEPRYRLYESSDCVALQCFDCGKHLRSLKKADFPAYKNLPAFEEGKEDNINKIYFSWVTEKAAACKKEEEEFRRDLQIKMITGELYINDNSMFATYYSSIEWARTRERIFKRDNYRCRISSCHNAAECVHHIVYDRFGEEHDFDLISLCQDCHKDVHLVQDFFPYPYKLKPSEIENFQDTLKSITSIEEEKTSSTEVTL